MNFGEDFLLLVEGVVIFLVAISLWRLVVPSPKIVKNFHMNFEKLPCKGEPHRFSGYQDSSVQRQTNIL